MFVKLRKQVVETRPTVGPQHLSAKKPTRNTGGSRQCRGHTSWKKGFSWVPSAIPQAEYPETRSEICMWYATAIHESDHGTSKHWRLPVRDALNAWGQTTYVQNQVGEA